jgi:hypothetical protein
MLLLMLLVPDHELHLRAGHNYAEQQVISILTNTKDVTRTSRTIRQENFVQRCGKEHSWYIRERSQSCVIASGSFHAPHCHCCKSTTDITSSVSSD